MASLQSFQPSADRFCSWLTRIEETAAKLESDGEKLRAKYGGDQSLPVEELKPFKVRKGFLLLNGSMYSEVLNNRTVWNKHIECKISKFNKCKGQNKSRS